MIATILSFRSKSKLSKQEIKQEIVRKARYALKKGCGSDLTSEVYCDP